METTSDAPELEELVLDELKELLLLRSQAQQLLLACLEDVEKTRGVLRDPSWTMKLQEAKEAVKHQVISL